MTLKILTAIAVATGVLAMSNAAEAGGKKRHGFHGHDHVKSVQHKRHHKHRRYNRRDRHFSIDFGNYHYPSVHSCRRLKKKAYYTGSRYWWKKYQRCINRYY